MKTTTTGRDARLRVSLASALALLGMSSVLLAHGCRADRGAAGPAGPGEAALVLFELAHGGEPDGARIARSFELPPGDDGQVLDALAMLAGFSSPRVESVQRLGSDAAVVDLRADLHGGGSAAFTVQLRAGGDARWRAVWFQGPGVTWPPPDRRGGEGLSSSAPPG